jgi:hypothetical protein
MVLNGLIIIGNAKQQTEVNYSLINN